jgi:hypothetical protein
VSNHHHRRLRAETIPCPRRARPLGNGYILEDAIVDNRLGTILTGSRSADIKTELFCPVYEYFKYGDYRPKLNGLVLEGLGSRSDGHGREVIRCGQTFHLARELRIDQLMSLVCRKFTLLKKEPLPVMMAVRLVFKRPMGGTEHDKLLREMLVDEVAGNYWIYMEEQAKNVKLQAMKTPDFDYTVWRKYGEKFA